MEKTLSRRFLCIEAFTAKKTVFKVHVEFGTLTAEDIKRLLRALASKPPGQSYQEIIQEFATPRSDIPDAPPLEEGSPTFLHGSGSGPLFAASVVGVKAKSE